MSRKLAAAKFKFENWTFKIFKFKLFEFEFEKYQTFPNSTRSQVAALGKGGRD
jgi:hypothetical protein